MVVVLEAVIGGGYGGLCGRSGFVHVDGWDCEVLLFVFLFLYDSRDSLILNRSKFSSIINFGR